MNKGRNISFDIAKGIGIILVVIGHTMSPIMSGNIVMENIYDILYIFHMPLFFLLSGLVSSKLIGGTENSKLKWQLLKQRAIRLMVPYFFWAVVYSIMKPLMKEQVRFQYSYAPLTILIGNNPEGQLWFLYVLFIVSAIVILCVRKQSLKWWTLMAIVISVVTPIIPANYSLPGISLSFSLYQVGYYFIGLCIIPQRDTFFRDRRIAISGMILFIGYLVLTLMRINVWYLKAIAGFGACCLILFFSRKLAQLELGNSLAWQEFDGYLYPTCSNPSCWTSCFEKVFAWCTLDLCCNAKHMRNYIVFDGFVFVC